MVPHRCNVASQKVGARPFQQVMVPESSGQLHWRMGTFVGLSQVGAKSCTGAPERVTFNAAFFPKQCRSLE